MEVSPQTTTFVIELYSMASFFNLLKLNESPAKRIERCKTEIEYNFLTEYEVKRLLSKLDKEFRRKGDFDLLRESCIIKLMLETGIRSNECLRLLPSDVHLNQSVIYIRAEIAKNRVARFVPISEAVLHCLKHIIREQRKIEAVKPGSVGLWFNKDGTPYSYNSLAKKLKKFSQWADVPAENVHCRNFRHYCATSRLKAGEAETVVKQIMGHIDDKMMAIYTHYTQADLWKAIKNTVQC